MGQEVKNEIDSVKKKTDEESIFLLEELRRLLKKGIGRHLDVPKSERVFRHISSVAKRKEILDFQLATLQCYVGGYIFIDPEERDVVPLFGSSERTKGAPAYPLKYVWKDNGAKRFEKVVDKMFLCWRLSESIKLEEQEKKSPPEYIYHLPLAYTSVKYPRTVHPVEEQFRDETGCHYCSMGEVAFYIYAWRFFIRLIWHYGESAEFPTNDILFSEDENKPFDFATSTMWDVKFWEEANTRERQWVDFIEEKEMTNDKDWNELIRILQEKIPVKSPWNKDWESMLLVKWTNHSKIELGETLLPLLKYATFSAEENGYTGLIPELKSWQKLIATSKELTIDELMKVDHLLKNVVCHYFSIENNSPNPQKPSAKNLLKQLHKSVRFPVIAYFYWIASDRAMRTHLVLPVWTSNMETFHVTLELPSDKNESNKQDNINTKRVDLGIMGVAVLGIHPLEELDWTICDSNPTHFNSKRFAFIRQYYEIFAAYVADDWLYRRLRKRDNLRTEEMAKDMAHRLGNPLGRLGNYIWDLYEYLIDNNMNNDDTDDMYENIKLEHDSIEYYREILCDMVPDEEKSKVNIIELIMDMVSSFNDVHEVEVSFEHQANETPCYYIYKNALKSILHELIYNAYKFTRDRDDGWIHVCLSITDVSETIEIGNNFRKQLVKITIEDNGPGIHSKIRKDIYNRGKRGEENSTGSTGFGLYRVKELVEEVLNGKIDECGKYGKGAKFEISLILN